MQLFHEMKIYVDAPSLPEQRLLKSGIVAMSCFDMN